ncbi:MAG: ABC transporter [Deltaproteobacteria bacterium]|nr:MAG: ABC transporter [Deltaproteobacteria bacterium]
MLRLDDIVVRLGDFCLNSVSLSITKGEYLVLLGPTGTGKTVLLETIAGIHRPRKGRIWINGRDVTRQPPEKRGLGIVYQDYALFPHLNVEQNIAFGLRSTGMSERQSLRTMEDLVRFLDIGHLLKRRPAQLSGGEQQRVALARALVMKPFLLLLDEPLSALDRASRDRLRHELKRIHREIGVTILHITHDLEEALFLADRMAIMENGSILQHDRPEAVFARPNSRAVAKIAGIRNLLEAIPENGRWVTFLGVVDIEDILKNCATDPGQKICISIPGWNVEVFPGKPEDSYLWKGTLRVAETRLIGDLVDLVLSGGNGGDDIRTSLSRREWETLSPFVEQGKNVPVGICKKGIHCIM